VTRYRLLRTGAIVVTSALFFLPLVFMFLGSLRFPGLPTPDGFEFVPSLVRWENYQSVFLIVDLGSQMRNSLTVVLFAVPITVLIASLAGYAIVASKPKTRKALIIFSIAALMIPVGALLVPRFVLFRWLGLIDSLSALVAPAFMATTPFYVLIFALAYSRIPKPLFEAARVEGLGELAIWRRVAWPLGRPAAFAVGVLAFVFHWSNFIDALLFIQSPERYTLALGLRALQTLEPSLHSILLSGAVIATIPAVVAFLLVQRAFFTKTIEGG
jgi:multiple sugar transport system permease protein